MRDSELYQQVLGLKAPWSVSRVELNVKERRVDVWVEHPPGEHWACPTCGQSRGCYDHAEERVWRHLDTCQFQTHLHARIPRIACAEHGIAQVAVPWAEARSHFTLLMERWIIDVLRECQTISGTCELLGVSWDEAALVMKKAVARGLARKPARPVAQVGVDEKAFKKGHSYVTVVCDLQAGTVEHVAEHRTRESLAGYYRGLSGEQRAAIEAVAMDMWEPYVQATLEELPLARDKIVFDRFHIMKQVNQGVDRVRLEEHRTLRATGDDTLKGTKHWWLYAAENLPDQHKEAFEAVQARELRTARAWAMKETLRGLWKYSSRGWARRFFQKWFGWVSRSRLQPMKKAARTLKNHLDNILTYCLHPITNAVAEGLNSKIMTFKRKAAGFRSFESFRNAIYFYCGGLDLYPC
jgi:transposase